MKELSLKFHYKNEISSKTRNKIINEKKYNLNPSYCKNCGEQLDYYHRKSKFCNQSCSASFNNIGVCRNEKKTIKKKSGKTKGNYDLITDKEFILIINSCNSWKELSLKFHYKNEISSKTRNKIINKAKKFGIDLNYTKEFIKDKTKDEIFNLSKNWQSARSTIRKDAS